MSPASTELLNKLINDYYHNQSDKAFNPDDASAIIHNLFIGKYSFSFNQYNEIFTYLCNLQTLI